MSVQPDHSTGVQVGCVLQLPAQEMAGEAMGNQAVVSPLSAAATIYDGPEPEQEGQLGSQVGFLRQTVEETQAESTLLKECAVRMAMYVDCLVDALETHQVTHLYDVDGSLLSLDECRQKAKTLQHTRQPHCDEDIRSRQCEAEIDELRQEVQGLSTDLEGALQRLVEQGYALESLQTAEYQANRRWEVYHEHVVSQWSQCYGELQARYKDAEERLQRLQTAHDELKRSGAARHAGHGGGFGRADPFRRYRPGLPRRGMPRAAPFQQQFFYQQQQQQQHRHQPQLHQQQLQQRQQRQLTAWPSGADQSRGCGGGGGGVGGGPLPQGRGGPRPRTGDSDPAPVPAIRTGRSALLKQFFANLDMIQRHQQGYAAAASNRQGRPREPRPRQPGPYGEAR